MPDKKIQLTEATLSQKYFFIFRLQMEENGEKQSKAPVWLTAVHPHIGNSFSVWFSDYLTIFASSVFIWICLRAVMIRFLQH